MALATCARFPDLDAEDRLVIPALAALGIEAVPAVWNDADTEWAQFDLVVLRETWDYVESYEQFLEWLREVEAVSRLLNPADVVQWNTDKRYLLDLAAAGVPVVPTLFLEPGSDPRSWTVPAGYDEVVVKPVVSAGSRDTMRHSVTAGRAAADAHVRRLLDAGRAVMVQPYLAAVDTVGETALLFVGGAFSHAIRKGPLLQPDVEGERVEGLFVQEQIDPRESSAAEREVAVAALAAVPGGADALLYARVDLIPGPDGAPLLLELELTEPSLFLSHADGAADRLARAVQRRLASA